MIEPNDTLFLVTRASDTFDKEKPCHEAFTVEVPTIERRWASGKADTDWYNKWLSYGRNHHEKNDHLYRIVGSRILWAVRLPDMTALRHFLEEHGDCVLGTNEGGYNTLLIYDTYIE